MLRFFKNHKITCQYFFLKIICSMVTEVYLILNDIKTGQVDVGSRIISFILLLLLISLPFFGELFLIRFEYDIFLFALSNSFIAFLNVIYFFSLGYILLLLLDFMYKEEKMMKEKTYEITKKILLIIHSFSLASLVIVFILKLFIQ